MLDIVSRYPTVERGLVGNVFLASGIEGSSRLSRRAAPSASPVLRARYMRVDIAV